MALKSACKRPADLAARYGGEEFAIVLPDTPQDNALLMAEKLRAAVEHIAVKHEHSSAAQVVTMSLGVCTLLPEPGDTSEIFLRNADEALYRAKQAGRNRSESNF